MNGVSCDVSSIGTQTVLCTDLPYCVWPPSAIHFDDEAALVRVAEDAILNNKLRYITETPGIRIGPMIG